MIRWTFFLWMIVFSFWAYGFQYSLLIFQNTNLYEGRIGSWLFVGRKEINLVDIAILYNVNPVSIMRYNGVSHPVVKGRLWIYIPKKGVYRYYRILPHKLSDYYYGKRGFLVPVDGRITSLFGPRWGRLHYGLDIAAPVGTIIRAADSGIVDIAGWVRGYGRLVRINHQNGFFTYYGHCSKLLVKVGDKVEKGEEIALVGATGRATGPHLHFEIRYLEVPSDPLFFLQKVPIKFISYNDEKKERFILPDF